ncbi:MAG TPA: 3-phosphoserine/phosphohydroxythreonine transaminase [bacterium]|nr:3-phosphoserine/phosphohydroxythreonine transaminase [bacterium]HPN43740.1 3-phosphoserine/phosphohydroxythreonine transaminase [bacterium]
MGRVYNFSAGPAILPESVLKKAAAEIMDYQGTGMSVMEMSHRSKPYEAINDAAEALLRELMGIPDNYQVIFMQGGASSQFAMVPLNLFHKSNKADYVNTGEWSKKAIAEAKKYGAVRVVASSEDKMFSYIPRLNKSMFDQEADYAYIVTNNTIFGTLYPELPDVGKLPLVADMSSNFLSQVYDVSKFALIFAGAQKNVGPAGVTVVIIRNDMLGHAKDITPTMFNYKIQADAKSLYNTPPCYTIYIAKLVFEWLKEMGGIPVIEKINREKAAILYNFLDNSTLFKGTVNPQDRSLMNVPFVLPSEELNENFIKEATQNGFVQLKGHRSVGGMRASIYNAMPIEGVKKLVEFMKKFEMANK